MSAGLQEVGLWDVLDGRCHQVRGGEVYSAANTDMGPQTSKHCIHKKGVWYNAFCGVEHATVLYNAFCGVEHATV
jgi:hypothetical protein